MYCKDILSFLREKHYYMYQFIYVISDYFQKENDQ